MGEQRRYRGVEGVCTRAKGYVGVQKTIQGSRREM